MKQKKMIIFIVIALIATLKFAYTIIVNDNFIKKYSNGVYDEEYVKKLLVLNIQEPYIAHYNYGNTLYQLNKYNEAKTEYEEALKTVSYNRECDVRVNLALTEINLIDTEQKSDDLIKEIENIKKVLLEDNCATTDQKGRDKKSQDLYDLLEQLKNSGGQSGQQGGSEGNEPDNPNGENVIENEQEKIGKIKQSRQKASQGRNPSNDHDYNLDYKDKVW